jgi:hypothetical protein
VAELRVQRNITAVINIQRLFRGYRDRKFIRSLQAERLRFLHMHENVVTIQGGFRIAQANKIVKEQRSVHQDNMLKLIQKQVRVHQARRIVNDLLLAEEPLQVQLVPTSDPQARSMLPWSVQLWCAPWQSGTNETRSAQDRNARFVNLFSNVSPDKHQEIAATKLQAVARGNSHRKKTQEMTQNSQGICRPFANEICREAAEIAVERERAALKIQKVARGRQCRNKDHITEKMKAFLTSHEGEVVVTQAYLSRSAAQDWLAYGLYGDVKDKSAKLLQASWRGWLARRHVDALKEEAVWPIKSWFEYFPTGSDTVQIAVRFVPNPRFDDFRHFMMFGKPDDLATGVQDMSQAVDFCVDTFLSASEAMDVREESRRNESKERHRTREEEELRKARSAQSHALAGSAVSDPVLPSDAAPLQNARSRSQSKTEDRTKSKTKADSRGRSVSKSDQPAAPDATQRKPGSKQPTQTPQANADAILEGRSTSKGPQSEPVAALSAARETKGQPRAASKPAQRTEANVLKDEKVEAKAAPKARAESNQQAKAGSPKPATRNTDGKQEARGSVDEAATPKTKAAARQAPGKKPAGKPDTDVSSSSPAKSSTAPAAPSRETSPPKSSKDATRALPPVEPPKRKLPANQESKPFFESSLPSEAHRLLKSASLKYRDIPPIPPEGSMPRPRPPEMTASPMPPPSSTLTPEVAKAAMLKQSQSDSALEIKQDPPGAAPKQRKTYGGTLIGKEFVRSSAENVEDMSPEERQQCLDDIERRRQETLAILEVKKKFHKERKKQREMARTERYQTEMGNAEALEEERRNKKVKELKKWLKLKEDQVKAKKEREQAMIAEVMQKEVEKSEAKKVLDQKREEERDRRLKAGERQKAKVEAQMMMSRQQKAEQEGSGSHTPADPQAAQVGAMGYPQGMAPFPGQQRTAAQQRVVHRHIHHHVHYHEGNGLEAASNDEEGGAMPSVGLEERQQIEMASEARVRSQLETVKGQVDASESQSQHHFHQHLGLLPQVDSGAVTPPTMFRQAYSMGALPDGSDRTQEAFYKAALPQSMSAEMQEVSKRRGLKKYAAGVDRAFSSYADAGRPLRCRPACVT